MQLMFFSINKVEYNPIEFHAQRMFCASNVRVIPVLSRYRIIQMDVMCRCAQARRGEPEDAAPVRDGSEEVEQELVRVRLGARPDGGGEVRSRSLLFIPLPMPHRIKLRRSTRVKR